MSLALAGRQHHLAAFSELGGFVLGGFLPPSLLLLFDPTLRATCFKPSNWLLAPLEPVTSMRVPLGNQGQAVGEAEPPLWTGWSAGPQTSPQFSAAPRSPGVSRAWS